MNWSISPKIGIIRTCLTDEKGPSHERNYTTKKTNFIL